MTRSGQQKETRIVPEAATPIMDLRILLLDQLGLWLLLQITKSESYSFLPFAEVCHALCVWYMEAHVESQSLYICLAVSEYSTLLFPSPKTGT